MSDSINSKTNLDKNVNNRKKPRLEKLALPRKRIDNSLRLNAFQVRNKKSVFNITKTYKIFI